MSNGSLFSVHDFQILRPQHSNTMDEGIRVLLKEAIKNEEGSVVESYCPDDTQYIKRHSIAGNRKSHHLPRDSINTREDCGGETLLPKNQCSPSRDAGEAIDSGEDLPAEDNSPDHPAMSQRFPRSTREMIDRPHHYPPQNQRVPPRNTLTCDAIDSRRNVAAEDYLHHRRTQNQRFWRSNYQIMEKYSTDNPCFPKYSIPSDRRYRSMLTRAFKAPEHFIGEVVPRSYAHEYNPLTAPRCHPDVIESLRNEERFYIRRSCKRCILANKSKSKSDSKAVGRCPHVKRLNRLAPSHPRECTTDSTELPIQAGTTNVFNTDDKSPESSATVSETNSPAWSRTASDAASSRTTTPPAVDENPPKRSTPWFWFPGKSKSTVSLALNSSAADPQTDENPLKRAASWFWFPGKSKSTVSLQKVTTPPQDNFDNGTPLKKKDKSPAVAKIAGQISTADRRVAVNYDRIYQKFLFPGPVTTKR